jgi:Domain of unknown function (DUF397)
MDITEVTGWRKPRRSFSNGNCLEAAAWRKPLRSYGSGGCLEAANWRTSASSNSGGCVETGSTSAAVLVRDSKDRDGAVLAYSPDAWRAFTDGLKAGAL